MINSIARKDIGFTTSIPEGAVISEKSQYRIKKPGIYEISGIAEFSVKGGGKNEVYKIETARESIQVSD